MYISKVKDHMKIVKQTDWSSVTLRKEIEVM